MREYGEIVERALDSGQPVVKLRFLRGDRWKVREVTVRLAAAVEAAA